MDTAPAGEPALEKIQMIMRLKKELSELRDAAKAKELEYTDKQNDLKNKVRF